MCALGSHARGLELMLKLGGEREVKFAVVDSSRECRPFTEREHQLVIAYVTVGEDYAFVSQICCNSARARLATNAVKIEFPRPDSSNKLSPGVLVHGNNLAVWI